MLQFYYAITLAFFYSTLALANNNPILVTPWTGNDDPQIVNALTNNQLIFKGAIELKSTNTPPFGGFSSCLLNAEGDTLTCISDFSSSNTLSKKHRSAWHQFRLLYNEKNEIINAEIIRSGQVYDNHKNIVMGEIESMAQINSNLYVSFDNKRKNGNQIWMLPPLKPGNPTVKWLAKPDVLTIPQYPLKKHNEGIECMTETSKNQLFLIHETLPGLREKSHRFAWIINPSTNAGEILKYKSKLQEVKGATTLNNGNIIVLEKTFNRTNQSTRISLLELTPNDLRKESIQGHSLFDVSSKHFDNFEGIASFFKDGKEFILLISDNNADWNLDHNGLPIQKNIVLLFELRKDL